MEPAEPRSPRRSELSKVGALLAKVRAVPEFDGLLQIALDYLARLASADVALLFVHRRGEGLRSAGYWGLPADALPEIPMAGNEPSSEAEDILASGEAARLREPEKCLGEIAASPGGAGRSWWGIPVGHGALVVARLPRGRSLPPLLARDAMLVGLALGEREQTEELRARLAESEGQNDLLQRALDSIDDPVVFTNPESEIVIANRRAKSLLSVGEFDSSGRRRAVELNDLFFTAFLSSYAVAHGIEDRPRELTLVDPQEGSDLPFEALLHPVEDGRGRFLGVLAVLRNITDLKRAVNELQQNFERLQSAETEIRSERDRLELILQNVGDPIIVSDPENRITLMNERARTLFGGDPERPVDPAHARANIAQLATFLADFVFDFSDSLSGDLALVDPASKREVPLEVVAGKMRDARGQVRAVVSVLHDQTQLIENERLLAQVRKFNLDLERRVAVATRDLSAANRALQKQTEALNLSNLEFERINQVLLAEKRKLTAILESLGEGIIVADPRQDILLANHAAATIFGVERETAMLGEPLGKFFPREQTPIFEALAARGSEEPMTPMPPRFSYQRGEQYLQVQVSPLLDSAGSFSGLVCTVRDITIEHEVDQMKSDFISVVSHELRTPLTSIRGALQLAIKRMAGQIPEGSRHYLDISLRNTDRLIRLINDILDISRLESGKVELRTAASPMAHIVDAALVEIQPLAREKSIEVTRNIDESLPPVRVDHDRIVQVLVNLLNNAIKFSPPGAPVEVRVGRPTPECGLPAGFDSSRFALVEISDAGPGIARHDLDKLFRKFQQLDTGDSRSTGGTGLGLAISKELIERHQGHIWLQSEPGEGSIFRFVVPLATDLA